MIHKFDIRDLLKSAEKLIYWTMEVAVWVYHNIHDYCDIEKWNIDVTIIQLWLQTLHVPKKRGKKAQ